MASGLALAAELVAPHSAANAQELRELAAVAAVRVIDQEKVYAEARELFTAEAHAEMDAEIASIERGEVEMVPFEEVVREREEMARRREQGQSGGQTSAAS